MSFKVALIFLCFLAAGRASAQDVMDSLRVKALNNQDPLKWNATLLERDKANWTGQTTAPLQRVPFPVEDYDFYVFSKPFYLDFNGGNFSCISFGSKQQNKDSTLSPRYETTLMFFTGAERPIIESDINSRNFPYLTFQGTLDIGIPYEFVGVVSPDSTGFMILSMKTFDLRFGRTIVIYPNPDKTFYYQQFDDIPRSEADFGSYIKRIEASLTVNHLLKGRD